VQTPALARRALAGSVDNDLKPHADACRAIEYGHGLKATMRAIATGNSSIIQAAGPRQLYDAVGRRYLRYAPFLAHALSVPVAHDEEFLSFVPAHSR
jgi:hypothetical protein